MAAGEKANIDHMLGKKKKAKKPKPNITQKP